MFKTKLKSSAKSSHLDNGKSMLGISNSSDSSGCSWFASGEPSLLAWFTSPRFNAVAEYLKAQ